MASDDVIELGSSDEETEPAPKRRKPPLNAMVHIPGKLLSGLTVTPSKTPKPKINPVNIIKGSLGQAVTVTKITKSNVNPLAANRKLNGNPTKANLMIKPVAGVKRNVQIPVQRNLNIRSISGGGVSLANIPKTINPLARVVQKASSKNLPNSTGGNNLNIMKSAQGKMPGLKKPILKNNLPPGITIKRTTANIKNLNSPLKLLNMTNIGKVTQGAHHRAVFTKTRPGAEVPTVNLDDDEPSISLASGPQWYLRPEDQGKAQKAKTEDKPQDPLADSFCEIPIEKSETTSPDKEKSLPLDPSALEKQNNKEPDKSTYIEITIEDSPIKPTQTKKGFKVGAELAITIDDSPIKTKSFSKKTDPSDSENEEDEQLMDRHSKKKLEYPKTIEAVQIVEIEFEPLIEPTNKKKSVSPKESESSKKSVTPPKESVSTEKSSAPSNSHNKNEKPKTIVECIDIVEIEESPVKPFEEVKMTTPKKNKPTKPEYKMTQQIETIDLDKEKDEFSPIYQSFINLCFHLENSDDMKKIVEKKIKAYYRQVPKEYTESESFKDMVAGKIVSMKAGPEKMYLYIKDVVDELNLQRKVAKAQPVKEKEEQQKFLYGEDSEFDAKRQRQIRKLEKTLKKLHRAIQKLEEQEVDFDDEEDSVYLLTERYKERSVRVHAKLCQLTNTKMPSEARVQIDPRPGQPKGPAKRIEKWINRKVPIGTPLPFPDFHDVLRCVRDANQEDKLGWNEADVMEEARDLFVRCGRKLQRRRQENEWRLAASRIPVDTLDPAEDSTDLKRKLEENRRLASKKETDVFNKYADRQNQLNLEAVEIGDKEAEESPVESDDEDPVEITDSLTNAEKRKERLKRLLQEKSKVSDDKGNLSESKPKERKISQKDTAEKLDEADICTKDKKDTEANAKKDESEISAKGKKDTEADAKKDESEISAKDDKGESMETDLPDKEPPKSDMSNKDGNNTIESDSSSKSKGDGSKVDSDVDELHLLEKLYSENEYNNSVMGSSDTGSPIAISDTDDKTSGDEIGTKKPSGDVISIENSSYSESEEKKEDSSKDTDTENTSKTKVVEETVETNTENGAGKTNNKTNNQEYNGLLDDILLASSDEADDTETRKENSVSETSINLRDDNISIGETLIIENRDLDGDSEASKAENSDKNTITDGSSVEGMEIGPIEINSEDQNQLDNIVETASVELSDVTTAEIAITKSTEASEEKSPAEITNIDSVETIEDDIANAKNIDATTSVKAVENVHNENVNETKSNFAQSINDDNIDKASKEIVKALQGETANESVKDISMNDVLQDAMNSTENIERENEATTDDKTKGNNDFEAKEHSSIQEIDDVPMKEIQDVIQREKSNEDNQRVPDKETKHNNNSVPEVMEVDSIDETL